MKVYETKINHYIDVSGEMNYPSKYTNKVNKLYRTKKKALDSIINLSIDIVANALLNGLTEVYDYNKCVYDDSVEITITGLSEDYYEDITLYIYEREIL